MVDFEIEITQLDEEAQENLRSMISVAWDILIEAIEDGSTGEGLGSESSEPEPKDQDIR